jgi:hypothetical protein
MKKRSNVTHINGQLIIHVSSVIQYIFQYFLKINFYHSDRVKNIFLNKIF